MSNSACSKCNLARESIDGRDWSQWQRMTPQIVEHAGRYECDRCGTPTRSVFERDGQSEWPQQLWCGLHAYVRGYDGGFFDTMPFAGEEPVDVHLCHDCSAWLCREIPRLAKEARGGHPIDTNPVRLPDGRLAEEDLGRCCEFAWSPSDQDVAIGIPHDQGH
jgi:hypothetical protein